jgi:hypothetical protein
MKRGGSKAASERVVRPRSPSTHKSDFVKVCGCRPHEGGAARTGAGVRKPPMEEPAGGVVRWRVRRYGDLTAVVPECEYNFCDMARTLRMGENTFRRPCNFKELRVVKKAHITTWCVMCLMAAFVPHRPNKYFQVTASNGIVLSSPYTPLAITTASPIASVRVFETVRDADVVSLRSMRSQRRR